MIVKHIVAVVVAFFVSIVSFFVLFNLGIRCDSFGEFIGFCIFPVTMLIVGFVGVFAGTLCLPEAERRIGSKRLLVIGLIFSVPPSFMMFFFPLIPLALGGFIPVFIFKKLDKETSTTVKERRLAIVLSVGICLIISFVVLLALGGQPKLMTKEKAIALFDKVGGVSRVNQEANEFFEKMGTNEIYFFSQVDRTKYPAISALGRFVDYYGGNSDSVPNIEIIFGTHFHGESILIFLPSFDTNKISERMLAYGQDATKFIQVTTNIFVTK
jgi:hypothetical protein